VLTGQQLIRNAKVRNLIVQQDGAKTAFFAFEDRYRALPGDYRQASTNINCGALPCPNGDGEIKENRAAFGCSSYKSKKEPGCGFTIWKSQGSFTITAEDVRQLLEQGEAQLESATPARHCVRSAVRSPRRLSRLLGTPLTLRGHRIRCTATSCVPVIPGIRLPIAWNGCTTVARTPTAALPRPSTARPSLRCPPRSSDRRRDMTGTSGCPPPHRPSG
jgi:hypothetical protein